MSNSKQKRVYAPQINLVQVRADDLDVTNCATPTPHWHPAQNIGGVASSPATPSAAPRPNVGSNAFVPRARVTLKRPDGTPINLENFFKASPQTPNMPRPASIRIESKGQRKSRLAAEKKKQQEEALAKGEVVRAPAKAGDLSHFGKITSSQPLTSGPSCGKKGVAYQRGPRTSSSSDMFSKLTSQAAETPEVAAKPAEPAQHRSLVLQPRSKPLEVAAEAEASQPPAEGGDAGYAAGDGKDVEPEVSEEAAKKKIAEDVKEFFAVRSLSEAEVYFTNIPAAHHHRLVSTLVMKAVESKEADAKLVADFFEQTVKKGTCSAEAFEAGLLPVAVIIDDIAIDSPKAFQLFAMIINGAGLDEVRRSNLASKSIDSDKLLALVCITHQSPPIRPAQHDVEVSIFVDIVIGLRNARKGASLFKIIPPTHHHTFVAKVTEAALAMEGAQITIIAEAFREAISQGACSSENCKNGITVVARTIHGTANITRFSKLATIVRGAGINATDCGEIAANFGLLSDWFMDMIQSIDRGQKSDERTVTEFLERLEKLGICSTALFPSDKKQDVIQSIVNDMASQAPDVLRKLSLMVQGGLD